MSSIFYELTETVRQSSDAKFAQILNRIRESSHTDDDFREMKIFSQQGYFSLAKKLFESLLSKSSNKILKMEYVL